MTECAQQSLDGREGGRPVLGPASSVAEHKALTQAVESQPSATLWSRVRAPAWALLFIFVCAPFGFWAGWLGDDRVFCWVLLSR